MTQSEALIAHRQLCDELHQLALEENRHLKEHRRLPDTAHLDRKRALITRLDASLAALREAPPIRPGDEERRVAIEKAREKILQILHLDRENEQLMLRYTLSRPGHAPRATAFTAADPAALASPEPTPAPGKFSQLQRLYDRLR